MLYGGLKKKKKKVMYIYVGRVRIYPYWKIGGVECVD